MFVTLAAQLAACENPAPTAAPIAKIAPCQIGEYSKADMSALKENGYAELTSAQINTLAVDMLACLGSPDPEMRDGIVFEEISALLRQERLDTETQIQMFTHLLDVLNGPEDADGFTKPFAALNMSEIVRADRVQAYLSPQQREDVVQATINYLTHITDYRGYDETRGWRHGIAHTADIVLQLSLNPNINEEQLAALRAAIATQISPPNGHSYIYGESERLARPLFYMAARGAFDQENWDVWLASLAGPAPYEKWAEVYTSEAGLAKLHNTKAFFNVLYISAQETKNENIKMLFPGARAALISMP